jgi:hypothetical protein
MKDPNANLPRYPVAAAHPSALPCRRPTARRPRLAPPPPPPLRRRPPRHAAARDAAAGPGRRPPPRGRGSRKPSDDEARRPASESARASSTPALEGDRAAFAAAVPFSRERSPGPARAAQPAGAGRRAVRAHPELGRPSVVTTGCRSREPSPGARSPPTSDAPPGAKPVRPLRPHASAEGLDAHRARSIRGAHGTIWTSWTHRRADLRQTPHRHGASGCRRRGCRCRRPWRRSGRWALSCDCEMANVESRLDLPAAAASLSRRRPQAQAGRGPKPTEYRDGAPGRFPAREPWYLRAKSDHKEARSRAPVRQGSSEAGAPDPGAQEAAR